MKRVMSSWTPEPWKFSQVERGIGTLFTVSAPGMTIAECGPTDERGAHTRLANAKRIVDCINGCQGIARPDAIPDVVRALEGLLTRFTVETPDGYEDPGGVISHARAALRKLRGDKP